MSNSKYVDLSLLVNKINHLHYLIFINAIDLEDLVLNGADMNKTNKNDILSEHHQEVNK